MPDLQPSSPTSGALAPDASAHDDALAHLAKMSGTGSAFGQADYVAINNLAIIALVLGVASALSLVLSLFLMIPVLAIVFGAIAIRQIRGSNGTQSGIGLAAGGIGLSILFGGGAVAIDVRDWSRARHLTQEAATVIERFGDDIKADQFDDAYRNMTTEGFRSHVTLSAFRATLVELRENANTGKLESIRWNNEPMFLTPTGDAGVYQAEALALLKLSGLRDPSRQIVRLNNREGDWKIDGLPNLFAEGKPRRGDPGI